MLMPFTHKHPVKSKHGNEVYRFSSATTPTTTMTTKCNCISSVELKVNTKENIGAISDYRPQ